MYLEAILEGASVRDLLLEYSVDTRENVVFDIDSADKSVDLLKKKINAPYREAYQSSLGGPENVSILIVFSLDEPTSWGNSILENSRYVKLYLTNKGSLELNTQSHKLPKKFRKTKVKTMNDVIKKINRFIGQVS